MKRYKINKAQKVNAQASKNGIKWRYAGKTDNWEKVVNDWMTGKTRYMSEIAIRVTDTQTNEIIIEQHI